MLCYAMLCYTSYSLAKEWHGADGSDKFGGRDFGESWAGSEFSFSLYWAKCTAEVDELAPRTSCGG